MLAVIDLSIATIIIIIAAFSLFSRKILSSIIYFIAFGLLVSLAWIRLGAPDVAIAEAAIGAGLTGALFLATWKRLQRVKAPETGEAASSIVLPLSISLLSLLLTAFVVGSIFNSVSSAGLASLVNETLPQSGVSNPVTAVLLNFRSFDTLLEIAVLFLTMLAIRALAIDFAIVQVNIKSSIFLQGILALVVPLSIIAGAYLLWIGSSEPGGAFQAGAIWAGALVIMQLANIKFLFRLHNNGLLSIGLGVFIFAAIATYLLTGSVLMYPADQAKFWILAIETAAAVSIAFILYELFCVSHSSVETKPAVSVAHDRMATEGANKS